MPSFAIYFPFSRILYQLVHALFKRMRLKTTPISSNRQKSTHGNAPQRVRSAIVVLNTNNTRSLSASDMPCSHGSSVLAGLDRMPFPIPRSPRRAARDNHFERISSAAQAASDSTPTDSDSLQFSVLPVVRASKRRPLCAPWNPTKHTRRLRLPSRWTRAVIATRLAFSAARLFAADVDCVCKQITNKSSNSHICGRSHWIVPCVSTQVLERVKNSITIRERIDCISG